MYTHTHTHIYIDRERESSYISTSIYIFVFVLIFTFDIFSKNSQNWEKFLQMSTNDVAQESYETVFL